MVQTDGLPLTEILDSQIISDTFKDHQVVFGIADEDVYTPVITLWAMVSQFLHQESARSCKTAAGRVVSLYAQVGNRVVAQNAGNFCRAKAKIPVDAISQMTRRIAADAEQQSLQFDDLSVPLEPDEAEERLTPQCVARIRTQPIHGRILNVDGFTIDAPDTAENQAVYPQNPAQGEGLGFPILRGVGLISMVSGMVTDLAYARYSGKETGETALLRRLEDSLRRGDTLVADSYYCTYWLIDMCKSMGVHIVMKNHHKREDNPFGAKRLSDCERIATWLRPRRPEWMSKRKYRQVSASIEIRLTDIEIVSEESRCENFTIASTMLDTQCYPKHWLGALFEGRWMIEPDIRSIKVTMGLEHLRAQSPEAIERELWTAMLTHNLIRVKMLQSGYAANRELRSMSFTETQQLLSTNWVLCACTGVSEAMAESVQRQGVVAIVGNRPNRVEPRENKRRPKVLKLMTVPRRLFNAAKRLIEKKP